MQPYKDLETVYVETKQHEALYNYYKYNLTLEQAKVLLESNTLSELEEEVIVELFGSALGKAANLKGKFNNFATKVGNVGRKVSNTVGNMQKTASNMKAVARGTYDPNTAQQATQADQLNPEEQENISNVTSAAKYTAKLGKSLNDFTKQLGLDLNTLDENSINGFFPNNPNVSEILTAIYNAYRWIGEVNKLQGQGQQQQTTPQQNQTQPQQQQIQPQAQTQPQVSQQ